MENILLFFGISMITLSIIYNLDFSRSNDILTARRKQTEDLFKENMIKQKLDKIIKERVKVSRRSSMEEKLRQAGFNFEFTEYILICIATAIVMAILFGTIMTNPYLAVLFLVFGFLTPYQVIAFIRNRRIALLDKQIGAFMQMTIKRYETTRNMHRALKITAEDFEGEEPIAGEVKKAVLEIDLGVPTEDALKGMAKRTGNKYMERFASYYEIAAEVGTDSLRRDLLTQAYIQYEENRKLKRELEEKISGPVKDAKIMIAAVPMFALYQLVTNDEYFTFMTKTTTGRIGTVGIIGTLIVILWFVNAKIGASID